jgi:hypothetical protein
MISWMHIIDIGHTAVMLPTAGAIAAWLISGRAWKLAFCWCLILVAGLGLVALSKIAFLGWGVAIPSIGFKALSGHAWRATAVIPVLFFVLLHGAPDNWRNRGLVLGIVLALALGGLLVIFSFHTASEVIASSILGISAGLLFVRASKTLPVPSANRWSAALSLLTFFVIFGLKPSSINHRLVDVALYLSGRDQPYRWTRHADVCATRLPETLHWVSKADLRVLG